MTTINNDHKCCVFRRGVRLMIQTPIRRIVYLTKKTVIHAVVMRTFEVGKEVEPLTTVSLGIWGNGSVSYCIGFNEF